MLSSGNKIKSVVIVGGGTAGWLTAAYLNRALGNQVKITVIESKTIGRIGVGEATVSSFRITMQFLGFKDEDWMHRCNATYKTAIKFSNWNSEPKPGKPDEYFYHPFFDWNENLPKPYAAPFFRGRGEGISVTHYWLKQYLEGNQEHFAKVAFPTPTLCDLQRSPRMKGSTDYEYNTAYHLDAQLVADFLRDVVIERGVEVLYDDVEAATQDERGYIASVKTKSGKEVKGEFFVDCTGFRGLLINQVLKVPFISENSSLLCDSAVAMPAKTNPEKDGINPYTIARTATSGWMWTIPLFHRDGCGYVYSKAFQGKDDAEKELRGYLGPRSDDSPANHINMRVGRNEKLWEKNVVAIGLSGCFIEPLESTTIFLIEYAIANFLVLFPDADFSPVRAQRFNKVMTEMFNEIRDFIILHYYLANRQESPFWKEVKKSTLVPDSLKEKLEFFEESLPLLDEFSNLVFKERSYTCILSGMNRLPKKTLPTLEFVGTKEGYERLDEIKRNTARLAEKLPGHYEYIKWLYENSNKNVTRT
jgi:flavin-dependent dehydrogenase